MTDRPQRLPSCIHGLVTYCKICDEKKMRKFNLERALAGDKVVCRDGSKVIELKYFDNSHRGQRLVGIVEDSDGDIDICWWNDQGRFINFESEAEYDLFMAPTEKTYYVNVYRRSDGHIKLGKIFNCKPDCAEGYSETMEYIKTIEFTVEE